MLEEAIRTLRERIARIDVAIAALQALVVDGAGPSTIGGRRRGRKPGKMTPAERLEVSRRMRDYWAARRKETARARRLIGSH